MIMIMMSRSSLSSIVHFIFRIQNQQMQFILVYGKQSF